MGKAEMKATTQNIKNIFNIFISLLIKFNEINEYERIVMIETHKQIVTIKKLFIENKNLIAILKMFLKLLKKNIKIIKIFISIVIKVKKNELNP